DDGPLPNMPPLIDVCDTGVRAPLSVFASATLVTPLPPVSTRSVAEVRNATRWPLSLIDGWSDGPLPEAPEGPAETRNVRDRTTLGSPWLRWTKVWVGSRKVCSY